MHSWEKELDAFASRIRHILARIRGFLAREDRILHSPTALGWFVSFREVTTRSDFAGVSLPACVFQRSKRILKSTFYQVLPDAAYIG